MAPPVDGSIQRKATSQQSWGASAGNNRQSQDRWNHRTDASYARPGALQVGIAADIAVISAGGRNRVRTERHAMKSWRQMDAAALGIDVCAEIAGIPGRRYPACWRQNYSTPAIAANGAIIRTRGSTWTSTPQSALSPASTIPLVYRQTQPGRRRW